MRIGAEPMAVLFEVWVKDLDLIPKFWTMIVVKEVADFMNDDVVDDFMRCHDEFAVEIEIVPVRTTPPNRRDVFDGNSIYRSADFTGEVSGFLGDDAFTVFKIPIYHGFFYICRSCMRFFGNPEFIVNKFDFDFGFV